MKNSETGFALILALMMLALLSLLAAGLLISMTTETRIGDNYRTEVQLLYLTEAGIEEGREVLHQGLLEASSVPFIQNRRFLDTTGRDAGRYSLSVVRTNPLTLRSVGIIGHASKTIEVRLKKSGFPAVPDAITLDEDVLWPSDVDPRISTTRGLERIVQGIVRNATDVYRPVWGEAAQLGSIGSSDDYRVVVVEGDCDLGNVVGYGVLLVRGELTVHGTFSWNGLVLVIGQGVVGSSDVVSGSISGELFLARTRENDRSSLNPLGTLRDRRGNVSLTLPPDSVSVQRSETEITLASKRFPYVPTTYREY
jgi:hypothetical protein